MSPTTSDTPPAGTPFAMFRPARSMTGSLHVRWRDDPGHEARLWLLLADPAGLTPDDLHPQRLLPHLIRIPVDAGARSMIVHVPVGRPLGVCIVGRDENDAPQSILPDACIDAPIEESPQASPPPSRPSPPSDRDDATFVLAPGASRDAVGALAARLASAAPAPPPPPQGPTGFGLRQQWYLSRIGFEPDATGAPRVVVRRTTFIDAPTIERWQAGPPPDAIALPPACDGVVDATTEVDTMAFFVVLEGPAPWRPLAVVPVSPPFDAITRPLVLGDAEGRLDALAAGRAGASDAFHDLLAAARRTLS